MNPRGRRDWLWFHRELFGGGSGGRAREDEKGRVSLMAFRGGKLAEKRFMGEGQAYCMILMNV